MLGGHLEVLKWARANGCPWDGDTCTYAAEGGHLDVLKWLCANGCPPREEQACMNAAWGGHLEMLQWMRANGCPWNKRACAWVAAEGGHFEVYAWLIQNGCPRSEEHDEMLENWNVPDVSPATSDDDSDISSLGEPWRNDSDSDSDEHEQTINQLLTEMSV